jgi:tetratricopeptide (TPR) repeat protein
MALSTVCLPGVVRAQTPGLSSEQRAAARQHFEAGARKYNLQRYDEAAAEFEAAYEISGLSSLLYNIAQALRAAGKHEKALRFYKNYLLQDEAKENRVDAEKRIEELTAIIEQQKKNAPPPEPTPQQPTTTPQPTVATPQPAQTLPSPPPAKKPLPRSLRYVGFGLIGLGVASLAVGGAMSGLAASASSDVQKAAANHDDFTTALRDTESRGKTYDAVSIVGYVAGGVFAAAGVALVLITRKPVEKSVAVAPLVGRGLVGVGVGGSF